MSKRNQDNLQAPAWLTVLTSSCFSGWGLAHICEHIDHRTIASSVIKKLGRRSLLERSSKLVTRYGKLVFEELSDLQEARASKKKPHQ
jgi:hypothetical protein